MGRNIRRREERETAHHAQYARVLSQPRAETGPDLGAIRGSVVAGFEDRCIRRPETWPGNLRTRDPGRIALALAKHAFARYPVAAHLERIWLGGERMTAAETTRRKTWYLAVAQGRSLHREHTQAFLSKRETHRFLAPPVSMGFLEALWYAVARTHTDDHGAAIRVAKSKVARPSVSPFWKDAARFFVQQPAPLNQINDLVDYFEHRLQESPAFSLKGRTLASMRAGAEQWHRDLARRAKVAGGKWDGYDIPGYVHVDEGDKPHLDVTWTIEQILTGDALADEGTKQRHCVVSYKARCLSGHCAIWSLRKTTQAGMERILTLEMNRSFDVVQVRGYANRLAAPHEMRHLRAWGVKNGFSVRGG